MSSGERIRWLVCHACGWQTWELMATVDSTCPECFKPHMLHTHNNSDGELPNRLKREVLTQGANREQPPTR